MNDYPDFQSALRNAGNTSPVLHSASSESWRVEVDQIISGIAPRKANTADNAARCAATLVIPEAPNSSATSSSIRMQYAGTEPDVPVSSAFREATADLPKDDLVTSPAHPATLDSLRSACIPTFDDVPSVEEYGPLPPSPFARTLGVAIVPSPALSNEIAAAATTVHSALGPGLREHVYTQCLAQELVSRGLTVDRDVSMPVTYQGVTIPDAFCIALLVNHCFIVEVRSVERVLASHEAQVTTYMARSGMPFAMIVNFNEPEIESGLRFFEA